MRDAISPQQTSKNPLTPHWIAVAIMLLLLAGYVIGCLTITKEPSFAIPETERIWMRTVCYVLAILLFPLTNLIRHIQLRLNQTMPGDKSAKRRYLLTVVVSMALIHSVGLMGVAMFLVGDDVNTLYILVGMAALGAFLYRPKWDEYLSIVEALDHLTINP